MKRSKGKLSGLVGLSLGLALLLTPFSAIAVPDATIEGVLVRDAVHELPAPDVALSNDGRALIVWQDDLEAAQITNVSGNGSVVTFTTSSPHGFEDGNRVSISGINPSIYNEYWDVTVTGPTTFTVQGSSTDTYVSGGRASICGDIACSVVAAIVEADGTSVGTPFKVSGDIESDWYFSATQVTWNEDLQEWLVLMTSDTEGSEGVYAQRVSSTGALIGNLVTLPSFFATTLGDRGAVLALPANRDRVKASATWSSVDQLYLVTWWGEGNASQLPGGHNSANVFGYFMDGNLTSADDTNAAFLISNSSSARAHHRLVKQAYSSELDKWAFVWTDNGHEQLYLRTLSIASGAISADDQITVVNAGASGENYSDHELLGGIVWVDELDGWMSSWNVQQEDGTWDAWARIISPTETLGDLVQISDFGLSSDERSVDWMASHDIEYDPSEQVIYGVAHVEVLDGPSMAYGWTFSATTMLPTGWVEYIDPNTSVVDGETVRSENSSSSRPRISAVNGSVAVVYQNWREDWGIPTDVRYQLIKSSSTAETTSTGTPNLADTGFSMGWLAYPAFAAIAMGLIYRSGVRRRLR